MSRKTKQEKIIAELRRRIHLQEQNLVRVIPERTDKEKLNFETKLPSQPLVETLTVPVDLIKKDLLKTLILTGVAISLELVVYWIWR